MVLSSSNSYLLGTGACFALAGAACDLRSRRIPNRLTGLAFLTALIANTFLNARRGLLDSLAAGLLAGGVFAIMFFLGGMGGGDVKLMAAVAAFGGLGRLPLLLLATALAGGGLALAVAAYRGALCATTRRMMAWAVPNRSSLNRNSDCAPRRLFIPYGVAIALGALLTFYRGVLPS